MAGILQETPYEVGTADEKPQAFPLDSKGMASIVCMHTRYLPISVPLTLEEWILETGIKKLQNFIVKNLLLTGASREDREDLSQEILSRLIHAYGRDRRTHANWWGLLKPTIRFAAIDFLRYQRRRVKLSVGIEAEPMDCRNDATSHWTRNEMIEELHELKKKGCAITDEDIEILILKFYDKAKLAEIARLLGYKGPSSVHPKLHAAIDSVIAFRMAMCDVLPSLENSANTA